MLSTLCGHGDGASRSRHGKSVTKWRAQARARGGDQRCSARVAPEQQALTPGRASSSQPTGVTPGIFAAAGFAVTEIIPTQPPTACSVIEGTPL
jgi:hypothetical protein